MVVVLLKWEWNEGLDGVFGLKKQSQKKAICKWKFLFDEQLLKGREINFSSQG